MKRMAAAASVLLLTAAAPALGATSDAELLRRVRAAVVRHHLYDRPSCLDYTIERNAMPGVDKVRVSQLHNARCGGDPTFDVRLFDVIVDRNTGRMATDAANPDDPGGTYEVLK